MRDQIDQIYETANQPEPAKTAAPAKRTFHQTHSDKKAHDATPHDEHMTKYHTAWQQYYQQYYERYYLTQLSRMKPAVAAQGDAVPAEGASKEPEVVTKDEAVHELRDQLLGQVRSQGDRVRKSRHFLPIVSALVVALLFLLVQYNRVLIAQVKSYVSPGAIDPQNIVLDPTANAKVGPEPKLIIPKINVDAPVVYGLGTIAEAPIQNGLRDGVVHYELPGANSVPGQKGNTVILGHSSNDVFDNGDYKFVFVQLEKLQKGDIFYMNYNSTRYTYRISETKVILPTEVGSLIIPADKPIATLVTCVPIGTALKRLVVIAEQISPDPTKASDYVAEQGNSEPANIPGNSPTFFESLFGR
jgi:sortase A